MDGSGSGRNVRGVRNEWWVKRKLSLLVKSMPLSLICTRAGHVALIPGTEEFFIALSDHPEWGTSHAVWGEIEDWFATDFIAAHDYKESKHPDYGRHHCLADGLKSIWTGRRLASARGARASFASSAASVACIHFHAFLPSLPPLPRHHYAHAQGRVHVHCDLHAFCRARVNLVRGTRHEPERPTRHCKPNGVPQVLFLWNRDFITAHPWPHSELLSSVKEQRIPASQMKSGQTGSAVAGVRGGTAAPVAAAARAPAGWGRTWAGRAHWPPRWALMRARPSMPLPAEAQSIPSCNNEGGVERIDAIELLD